ncbi:hypothetical protein Tco_0566458 [Tanacetum coccineum]
MSCSNRADALTGSAESSPAAAPPAAAAQEQEEEEEGNTRNKMLFCWLSDAWPPGYPTPDSSTVYRTVRKYVRERYFMSTFAQDARERPINVSFEKESCIVRVLEYVVMVLRLQASRAPTWFNVRWLVIMESLVKKKQKGAILELKRRHLKKVSNCINTPYPTRKIRRICASSSQERVLINSRSGEILLTKEIAMAEPDGTNTYPCFSSPHPAEHKSDKSVKIELSTELIMKL